MKSKISQTLYRRFITIGSQQALSNKENNEREIRFGTNQNIPVPLSVLFTVRYICMIKQNPKEKFRESLHCGRLLSLSFSS